MSIKRKLNRLKKPNVLIPTVIAAVAVLGAAGYFLLQGKPVNLADLSPLKPEPFLSFADTKGWWKGLPTDTPTEAPKNLSVFMGDKPNNEAPCYVKTAYKTGTVDTATELDKRKKEIEKGGKNRTISPLDTHKVSMETPSGSKEYEVQQFSVSAGGKTYGAEFGYLQLSDGYIEAEGWCIDPKQLTETLPALKSIKLETR